MRSPTKWHLPKGEVNLPVGSDSRVPAPAEFRQVSLEEIVGNYDVIGVHDGVVLMQPLPHKLSTIALPNGGAVPGSTPDVRMPVNNLVKSASPSINRVEYNLDLRGPSGRRVYDQMRRSDGTVKMTLKIIKTPVHAARWFMEPFDEKKRSKKIADYVWWNLQHMGLTWSQLLSEILLQLDFGYYVFEKVWSVTKYKGQQMMMCSLEPRHPLDVLQADYDDHGRFVGFEMWGNPMDAELLWLPERKCVVFTNEMEAGDVEGISVLRSAYKHWYYSENFYKIDGIQKERHGIGIPCIQLPLGHTDTDLRLADEIGRNLRTNEKAHVVLPPNWEILMLKLEGQSVDALASAQHHKHEMAKNVLAPFVDSERGLIDETTATMFLKHARFIADQAADIINQKVIPELVQYNWPGVDEYPTLSARRIGDTTDWRTISFAVRNLVGAGIIQPDDQLEKWFRDEMDLSPKDPETVREVATPQAPKAPAAGQSRQAPAAGGMQQGKNAGPATVGQDKSGGTD